MEERARDKPERLMKRDAGRGADRAERGLPRQRLPQSRSLGSLWPPASARPITAAQGPRKPGRNSSSGGGEGSGGTLTNAKVSAFD